jgi:hypothetical protein
MDELIIKEEKMEVDLPNKQTNKWMQVWLWQSDSPTKNNSGETAEIVVD